MFFLIRKSFRKENSASWNSRSCFSYAYDAFAAARTFLEESTDIQEVSEYIRVCKNNMIVSKILSCGGKDKVIFNNFFKNSKYASLKINRP